MKPSGKLDGIIPGKFKKKKAMQKIMEKFKRFCHAM
jgi:hypothetical protein